MARLGWMNNREGMISGFKRDSRVEKEDLSMPPLRTRGTMDEQDER
jgi:hypothetical protein